MANKNQNQALVKALLNLTAPKIDNSKMVNQLRGFPQGMGSKQGVYNLPADYNVKNELIDAALFANSFAPVTGDIQSGVMAAKDLARGDYGNAALNAVGMLPFVAGMGGTIKNAGKRMSAAEAEALGYWHPVGNDKKLKVPVHEMTSIVSPMENLTIPKIVTPESVYGGVGVVAKGDRSGIGLLHEINNQKLHNPVPLEGGFRFMDYQDPNNVVWASNQGRVSSYANKIRPIANEGNDVYLVGTTAGHGATDYNTMMTDALIEQMKSGKISNKTKKEFDADLRLRRPEWLGIDHPDAIAQLHKTGELRHNFHDIVELGKYQNAGFPDIAATRKAITDPNLLDTPNGYSGYRIGKVDPNNLIITNPKVPHTTYDTAIGGNLHGQSGVQLPVADWFPDFIANRRAKNMPISGDAYAVEQAKPTQVFNQQWLDSIMPKYEQALQQQLLRGK